MPRWKALPEELDPQVREFATQLRRLVDRSGLSIAAVADRTGYSKTSWERYLNGRLLAPKGAIVALAEVTGTNPLHLTTMWELSERAWSRSEARHDMTMEAIRITQARDALAATGEQRVVRDDGPGPPGRGGSGGRTTPPRVTGAGPRVTGTGSGPTGGRPDQPGRPDHFGPPDHFGSPGPAHVPPRRAPAASPDRGKGRGRRRTTIFVTSLAGALLVIVGAVLLTDLGGGGEGTATAAGTSSAPAPASSPELSAGVECGGDDCTGEDPELMGCGGEFVETTTKARVGTALVEVRYSKTCGTAWARITGAAPGDTVEITPGDGKGQTGTVNADNDAYTPMVAVATSDEAKACATLTTGVEGCTTGQ